MFRVGGEKHRVLTPFGHLELADVAEEFHRQVEVGDAVHQVAELLYQRHGGPFLDPNALMLVLPKRHHVGPV